MLPTNNGLVTRLQPSLSVVRSQELEDEARRRRSEVSLDPSMLDEAGIRPHWRMTRRQWFAVGAIAAAMLGYVIRWLGA